MAIEDKDPATEGIVASVLFDKQNKTLERMEQHLARMAMPSALEEKLEVGARGIQAGIDPRLIGLSPAEVDEAKRRARHLPPAPPPATPPPAANVAPAPLPLQGKTPEEQWAIAEANGIDPRMLGLRRDFAGRVGNAKGGGGL
ncbi:MAG: hypothetical protein HYV09_18110 [Deltaproteobacteria bacterium]|nr:hypothetical protein [Deltaproteobacteria bacterium]